MRVIIDLNKINDHLYLVDSEREQIALLKKTLYSMLSYYETQNITVVAKIKHIIYGLDLLDQKVLSRKKALEWIMTRFHELKNEMRISFSDMESKLQHEVNT